MRNWALTAFIILATSTHTLAGYPTDADRYGDGPVATGDGGMSIVAMLIMLAMTPIVFIAAKAICDHLVDPILPKITNEKAQNIVGAMILIPLFFGAISVICYPGLRYEEYRLRNSKFYARPEPDFSLFCEGAWEAGVTSERCDAQYRWMKDHYPSAYMDPYPCQKYYGKKAFACITRLPYIP